MSEDKGNTAVHGDHDRVAMLSLRADGTPDQTPGVEIIGDREFAESATREQFRQQAASAAHARADEPAGDLPPQDVEDPKIAARQEVQEAAITAADKAATSTVANLFTTDQPGDQPASAEKANESGRRSARQTS